MVKKSYLNVLHLQELNVNEKLTLLFLLNEDMNVCDNSNRIVALLDYIVLMLGICKSSVTRSLRKLKKLNYISWTKHNYDNFNIGNYNIYSINYDLLNSKLGINNIKEVQF